MFSTDLEIDMSQYSARFQSHKFTVHAPEQFDDGFVLDLVSSDPSIRSRSHI